MQLDTSRTTKKTIRNLEKNTWYYFRVKSVHSDNSMSDYSNEMFAKAINLDPDINLILNGDFSDQINNWYWEVLGDASAKWEIDNDVLHCTITSGGDNIEEIQIKQGDITLLNGQDYLFEFDAWADDNRIIEALVGQDQNPYTNYSKIGFSAVEQMKKHFAYPFRMEQKTDFSACVLINCGTSDHDVYLDNISLRLVIPSAFPEKESRLPLSFTLGNAYPNPFNAKAFIPFQIPEEAHIKIIIYNLAGQEIIELTNKTYASGKYSTLFDAKGYASGIYFCKMISETEHSSRQFIAVKKMVLIK